MIPPMPRVKGSPVATRGRKATDPTGAAGLPVGVDDQDRVGAAETENPVSCLTRPSADDRRRALLRATLVVLGLTLLLTVLGSRSPAFAASASSMESEFLSLLNDERADRGLRTLQRVTGVDNVAREWSGVMAKDNKLKHRPDLREPFSGDWRSLAENVGVGSTPSSLHRAFMNSTGHRENILGDFEYVGIGVVTAGSRTWVTFNFVKGDPTVKSRYGGGSSTSGSGYATGAGGSGPFSDIDSSIHRNDIRTLDSRRIAISCATKRYCPETPLRRAEMAVMLTRMLNLRAAQERFSDVASNHPYAAEIGALAAAGITKGCNPPRNDRFCPEDSVTRQQMASFFVRALSLSTTRPPFSDVSSGNPHRMDIGGLARSRITFGCNPPNNSRFCPDEPVTRAQMASFIVRAMG